MSTPRKRVTQIALERISELPDDQKIKYHDALRDSIEWDPESSQFPPSPADIHNWHGIPLAALEAQLVLLNKDNAAELLKDLGIPVGLPTLRKTLLTDSRYYAAFNVHCEKVENRIVFTYAQVLVLVGYTGGMSAPPVPPLS